MNKLRRKWLEWGIQFVKFSIVGVSNTVISLLVTYIVIAIFQFLFQLNTLLSLDIATSLGYIAGVLNSYFWNRKYVFKNGKEESRKKAIIKMFICYGGTYLVSMILMNILVEYCNIPSYIAPIPRLLFTIPLNFIANKFWTFKDR